MYAGRQMQVEFAKSRLRGHPCLRPARRGYAKAGEILCRERIYAFPTVLQQACPVLDTGEDEGNAADGRFSTA
jgi:hypothetical protein